MKNSSVHQLAHAAAIASVYIVLTFVASALGLSSGAVQVRFSEALTILPVFTPAAVPGLFVGCLLSNLLTGCAPWDVVFGSLATLLGALGTRALRRRPLLATLPPVLSNTLIIPFVLAFVYHFEGGVPYFMLTVGAGEIISCCVLGMLLYHVLKRHESTLF